MPDKRPMKSCANTLWGLLKLIRHRQRPCCFINTDPSSISQNRKVGPWVLENVYLVRLICISVLVLFSICPHVFGSLWNMCQSVLLWVSGLRLPSASHANTSTESLWGLQPPQFFHSSMFKTSMNMDFNSYIKYTRVTHHFLVDIIRIYIMPCWLNVITAILQCLNISLLSCFPNELLTYCIWCSFLIIKICIFASLSAVFWNLTHTITLTHCVSK